MALEVTSPTPTPFLGTSLEAFGGVPALIGLPDGISQSIRTASLSLETYSPVLNRDLGDYSITDYGDLSRIPEQNEEIARSAGDACQAILGTSAIPVFLGGTHVLTPGAVRASLNRFPGLGVIQINAHADLQDEWEGNHWHERCAMRRVLDRLPPEKLVSLGVRSGTREEFQHVSDNIGTIQNSPIYLSINLSVFDPVFFPLGNRAEPGGIDWQTFAALLSKIPWQQVRACDIIGSNLEGHSALLAAKVVREVLLGISGASGFQA